MWEKRNYKGTKREQVCSKKIERKLHQENMKHVGDTNVRLQGEGLILSVEKQFIETVHWHNVETIG